MNFLFPFVVSYICIIYVQNLQFRFDHSGTGACLKRYSDPSYFKRVWAASHTEGAKNDLKEKKVEKFKV